MNTTLIIMAAGIGSRYGGGIKQLAKMGKHGEIIMDYSIYECERRRDLIKWSLSSARILRKRFKAVIGDRIRKHIDVEYVFQELSDIPEGFQVPEGRIQALGNGTGHPVL